MLIPVLTLFVGALSTAAGIQELVVQGILNNQLIPLIGGTIGAVAGALTLAAGISLLRGSEQAVRLTRAAALSSILVTLPIGMFGWGLAGWPMTLLGLAWPMVLLFHVHSRRSGVRLS